jgi:membrane-bound lytic murein transglycosylase D
VAAPVAASGAAPVAGAGVAAASAATSVAAPAATVYIVRAGDTVFGIASRVGLSARELMRINRIRDADFIFEGQRLRVAHDVATLSAAEETPDDTSAGTSPAVAAAVAEDVAEIAPAAPVAAGAPGAAAAATLAANTRAGGPTTRRAVRSSEPVTAAQAEAQSPSVGPDAGMSARAADSIDLAVAKDGTIRVIAEETLGHYADWLGVSASHLRELNHMKYGQAVLLGHKLRLDFDRTPREQFEQRRREFHTRLQAVFFEQRRILGTEVYIVRRGDSLWSIAQKYAGVPVWLLQQYNPDMELGELRAGLQLVVPRIEEAAGG